MRKKHIESVIEQAFKNEPRDQLVTMAGLPAMVAITEASNRFKQRYAHLTGNQSDPIDVFAAVLDLRNDLFRIATGQTDHKGLDVASVHRLLRGEGRDMLFEAMAGVCDMHAIENHLFDSGSSMLARGRMKDFMSLLEERLTALDAAIETANELSASPSP